MQFSTKTLYGTQLMFELALNFQKGYIGLKELAKSQGLSEKYSEQIIGQLKAAGLVLAQRGSEGGYKLARPVSSISVKEIVETLEGSLRLTGNENRNGHSGCDEYLSRMVWGEISTCMENKLGEINLEQLVCGYISQSSELNYEI